MQVVWTEPALDGISLAYDYIHEFNPRAARHVADTLRTEGDSLEQLPFRGRLVPGTNMRELISAYPYVIRYRIEGGSSFCAFAIPPAGQPIPEAWRT